MFVTSDFLAINYGIDQRIAKFFVDREPPADNLYWHKKLLYLRAAPGYLFIPLIVDLLFKTGISKEQLLSEEFVRLMEHVGHISALEETGKISAKEAIEYCKNLIKPEYKSKDWYNQVSQYFEENKDNLIGKFSSPFKALHRGDVFLFSLCAIDFSEALTIDVVQVWFALITTLLLLDDAEDLKTDRETGEENAFIESGLGLEGIGRIKELLTSNLNIIKSKNRVMALQLGNQYHEQVEQSDLLHR